MGSTRSVRDAVISDQEWAPKCREPLTERFLSSIFFARRRDLFGSDGANPVRPASDIVDVSPVVSAPPYQRAMRRLVVLG